MKRYEGSLEDKRQDAKGAKKLGVGLRGYERTARDRREDAKGQKRVVAKGGRK